jgi:hypothetical protein
MVESAASEVPVEEHGICDRPARSEQHWQVTVFSSDGLFGPPFPDF